MYQRLSEKIKSANNHVRTIYRLLCSAFAIENEPCVRLTLAEEKSFHFKFAISRKNLFAGWGRKLSGQYAVKLSKIFGLEFILMEDGFLRSIARKDLSVSIVADKCGIFYDAGHPSELEQHIKKELSTKEKQRARHIMELWQKHRLSKYNGEREFNGDIPQQFVLVIDQVFGDRSIFYGKADQQSFFHMLEAALAENPEHTIVLKAHPDVKTLSKKTHFDLEALYQNPRIMVITDNCHPVSLLERADAVYAVTSQVGFEALMWGKKVHTFGMPFYAGWGLTVDALPPPERRGQASLEQLIHAALIDYPRYIDLTVEKRCTVEQAIAYVALQRSMRTAFPQQLVAMDLEKKKQTLVKKFLQGSDITFVSSAQKACIPSGATTLVWGASHRETADKQNSAISVENGFLSFIGLGGADAASLSLIVDDIGIYYDASRPSRLEHIIRTQELTTAQLERACNLRSQIRTLRLSTSDRHFDIWQRPASAKKVILIIGEDENAPSIKLGSPELKSNNELIQQVRHMHKDAYILYKPHQNTQDTSTEKKPKNTKNMLYNEEIGNVDIDKLFTQIDELHTITSCIGFAALLQGIKVTCHGLPFYAGWGLTTDVLACERRDKFLSIDELAYAALVSYPRYMLCDKPIFVEPEIAIQQLANIKKGKNYLKFNLRKTLLRIFTPKVR